MAASRSLVLVSSDGERYEVSIEVARIFRTLEAMMETGLNVSSDEPVPLPNVNGKILGKIVAWAEQYVRCQTPPPPAVPHPQAVSSVVPVQPSKHPTVPRRKINLPSLTVPSSWELQFLERNRLELYDLLLAANYLDAKRLMDILCSAIASRIRGKDPAEIRKTFHASEPNSSEDTLSIDSSDRLSLSETGVEDNGRTSK